MLLSHLLQKGHHLPGDIRQGLNGALSFDDNGIIYPRKKKSFMQSIKFSEQPFEPVPLYCLANLFTDRHPKSNPAGILNQVKKKQIFAASFFAGSKTLLIIRTLEHPFLGRKTLRFHYVLERQTFSSFLSSPFDNEPTGGRTHPLTKAMGSFLFQIAGLKRPFHGYRSPFFSGCWIRDLFMAPSISCP